MCQGDTQGGNREANIMNNNDRLIPIEKIEKSQRGRKMILIDGLSNVLKDVKPGYAALLSSTFGNVPMSDRNKVSSNIRKHWKLIRNDKPSIQYTPDGIPQVTIKPE